LSSRDVKEHVNCLLTENGRECTIITYLMYRYLGIATHGSLWFTLWTRALNGRRSQARYDHDICTCLSHEGTVLCLLEIHYHPFNVSAFGSFCTCSWEPYFGYLTFWRRAKWTSRRSSSDHDDDAYVRTSRTGILSRVYGCQLHRDLSTVQGRDIITFSDRVEEKLEEARNL
jgi:hypothetical protein